MTKRTKQILLMIAVVVIAIVSGGTLYVYLWLKNSIPQSSGSITVEGVNNPVEITYDLMGIGQIWAESEYDGYFALGYLHASDRMFQMDMSRRMAQGTMSEILGEITLESDKQQRMVGHNRIVNAAISNLSEQNRQRLQAYADGINAYKKSSGALPFEYLLLGADFRDWTVYDCLTLLSFQTWYSDALQNHDEFFLSLKNKMTAAVASTLCYTYPDWAPTTIPETKKLGIYNNNSSPFDLAAPSPFSMSYSSNSWVVAPSKTASGKAILSSDPHLYISQLPQFWYMVGLHIKETNLNVLGISTPGLPFVIMGHNGSAAWAFTAGGIKVTQNYLEKINSDDSTQYLTTDGWEKFEYVVDSINVDGKSSPFVLTTKLTRHGPVTSQTIDGQNAMALHWAGYDIDINQSCQSGFDLQSVSTFEKFRRVVTNMGALNANWMYADVNGNIGYQLGTPIFDIQKEDNCMPLNGWEDEFSWQKYYAQNRIPFCKNPAQGWLATSNNLATRSKAFPKLSGSFAADRILRISEILRNKDEIDIDFLMRVQQDRVDAYLRRWRKDIAELLTELGNRELADSVSNWNGSTQTESRETAIVMTFLSQLKRLTFEDELGEMYQGVRTIWLDHVYHDSTLHFWFDIKTTSQVESKDDIAHMAITRALEIAKNKTWGELNSFAMSHPMASVPILGGMLNLDKKSQPWPGTAGTLNASFIVPVSDSTYQTIVGPSWRFLIDFADIDGAQFVLPAGNSGNPMSPHFYDFNQLWQNGEYWNVPISNERVKANAVTTLRLNRDNKSNQN